MPEDTVTIPISDRLQIEVSRAFADRIERAADRVDRLGPETNLQGETPAKQLAKNPLGELWLRGMRRYSDELQRSEAPHLYADVQDREEAGEVWAREILDRVADDVLDAPPESPVGRASRFRIDEELA